MKNGIDTKNQNRGTEKMDAAKKSKNTLHCNVLHFPHTSVSVLVSGACAHIALSLMPCTECMRRFRPLMTLISGVVATDLVNRPYSLSN